jgi:ribokinase
MKSPPRIIVIGSLVMDFVAKGPRLPVQGETVLGTQFGMFPGGKGANQAAQAGRLGAEVFMIGCIGDDLFGAELIASLRKSNVNTDFVRKTPSLKTAACCIHVDERGNNAIVIVPEANMACSPALVDQAADLIDSADVVLCQLEIPLVTVEHALHLAARRRISTILNPAPAQSLPPSILSNTAVLTPNETEAQAMLGNLHGNMATKPGEWESDTAHALMAMGPPTVILTLGERGAYLATRTNKQHVPTIPVKVKDATAAGDAFNGALAVALGEGQTLGEAVTFANAAGALSTTRDGAQPSLAWRDELEKLLDRKM